MTPHIDAPAGAFAPDVVMPGDPLRARRIATTMLNDAELVTSVRGIEGYTGTYDGKPMSVMASGMGVPSISIYAVELFRYYDVQRIVRVGTCGALVPTVGLRDIIIGTACSTDSAIAAAYAARGLSPAPSPALAAAATDLGRDWPDRTPIAGHIFTTDAFYNEHFPTNDLARLGVVAVEMEAAGLYYAAMHENREALAVLTTTDLFYSDERLTADERQQTVDDMIHFALRLLTASA